MRHSIAGTKLNRDVDHRRALIKNQARQLLELGVISTTASKGKIVVGTVEKLLTKAMNDTVHVRRQLRSMLSDAKLVDKTCSLAKMLGEHTSGMVKVVRLGTRRGDNTMMVRLELLAVLPKIDKESEKKVAKSDKPTKKIKEVKKEAKKTK